MKDYYIGLDIGTDSIGWAATDAEYHLLKFKGNAQWGIRLFDEGKTADDRRVYRSTRRRIDRKKYRIQCLEMLFDKEISKIDVAFFQRLRESNFWAEDKSVNGKYSLFNDSKYTDIEYHKNFPTIYHLRKQLIDSSVKFSNTASIMINRRSLFEKLSLKEQCDVLMQILNILHNNVRTGDLSLINEAKKSGVVTTSSKIAPSKSIKSFKIINQSVTGLFEQEIELLQ